MMKAVRYIVTKKQNIDLFHEWTYDFPLLDFFRIVIFFFEVTHAFLAHNPPCTKRRKSGNESWLPSSWRTGTNSHERQGGISRILQSFALAVRKSRVGATTATFRLLTNDFIRRNYRHFATWDTLVQLLTNCVRPYWPWVTDRRRRSNVSQPSLNVGELVCGCW